MTRAIENEYTAETKAVMLVKKCNSSIDFVITYDKLPLDFAKFKDHYEETLISNAQLQTRLAIEELNYDPNEIDKKLNYYIFEVENPFNTIADIVKHDKYEIIMKISDKDEKDREVIPVDPDLISKSRIPVWIRHVHSIEKELKNLVIALNPSSYLTEEGKHLTKEMLKFCFILSQQLSIEVHVVSAFSERPEEEAAEEQQYLKDQATSRELVQNILAELPPNCNFTLNLLPGHPGDVICSYATDHDINMIMIGARNAIDNPEEPVSRCAQYILDNLSCDLFVFKTKTKL